MHIDMRRGFMCSLIFKTFLSLLKNNTSMSNFIPKQCTPCDGTIHSPSPCGREVCFNKPRLRVSLVLASVASVATTTSRVTFLTISLPSPLTLCIRKGFGAGWKEIPQGQL